MINQKNSQAEAFKLKMRTVTLPVLQILDNHLDIIENQLETLKQKTPNLFQETPMILEVEPILVMDWTIDLVALCVILKKYGIIPVGVQMARKEEKNQWLMDAIQTIGMPVFSMTKFESTYSPSESASNVEKNSGKVKEAEIKAVNSTNATNATNSIGGANKNQAKIITKPIRSGQQVYAEGADLIVLSSVSHGAELLADGNIHVYGALRGRALAGIQGNTEARIFCQSLEADLLSIAGRYMVSEAIEKYQKVGMQQIYLENDRLNISLL